MFDATVREGVLRLRRPETRWLSTGWNGGRSRGGTAYNVSVPEGFDRTDLGAYREERLARAGVADDGDPPTLFTGVSMKHARGARRGPVVAYATAGLSNPAMLPVDPTGTANDDDAGSSEPDAEAPVEAPTEGPPRRPGTVNLIVGTTRRLADGAAPLPDRRRALAEADALLDEVTEIAGWYATLRSLVDDDPDDLTRVERLLHGFGYALAHGLFLGASSPKRVVRRLRLAYRSVGVDIDETESEAGAERTTFTCPYRDVGARIYGDKWVCHEKLDRVDDGYVTYLGERGIDYQRPRDCDGSERCYSTVARDGPELWWPKTPPAAVRARS